MLELPEKLKRHLSKSWVRPAIIAGVVTSSLSDEKTSSADWDEGRQEGTPGTDFPFTYLSAGISQSETTAQVNSTAGFTVGSVNGNGHLIFYDGTNYEVVSYAGSTSNSFTGLTRGLYRTSARSWNSGTMVFQLLIHHGLAPDFDLCLQPRNWVQRSVSGASPSMRMGHRIVYISKTNKFIMFGGYNGSSYLNDLWQFDPQTESWSQLSPAGGPPPPRAYHCMAYNSYHNEVWVYAGFNGSSLNDVWKYKISTNQWSTNSAWDGPYARHSAMCAMFEDKQAGSGMVVTGGLTAFGGGYPNGCPLTYYFSGDGWYQKANAPYKWAYGDACFMSAEGVVFVVGRTDTGGFYAGCYDPILNAWEKRATASPPTGVRFYPSVAYDDVNHYALLFGGAPQNNLGVGALHAYDIYTNKWLELADYSREGRTRHACAFNCADNELFVWGGAVNSSGPQFPSYPDPLLFRYYPRSAKYLTPVIDLGEEPTENGIWVIEDISDAVGELTSLTYTADCSDDGSSWQSLGAVHDGDKITEKHRYYRVHVELSNAGRAQSPRLQKVDAQFDVVENFCLADKPIGDIPPALGKVSALTSQIDPVKCSASIGKLDIEILDCGEFARRLVSSTHLRDKTVKLSLGVLEEDFSAQEFVPIFKGKIDDWDYDGMVLKLSVCDFLGELKKDIPEEDAGTGDVTPLNYTAGGIASNPVDILLDILKNRLNIPDRAIDIDSFLVVKDDPALADWHLYRVISTPTDAYGLCQEICRHIGAVMIPRENGKLSIKMLKAGEAPTAEWNERKESFRNAIFLGEAGSVRNFVATWWGWNGSGDDYDDFTGVEAVADSESIEKHGKRVLRTKSKWLGMNESPYWGAMRAREISERILNAAKNGVPIVKLETNLSALGAQVGDVVKVRSAVVTSLEEYKKWRARFVGGEGRYSIPYLVGDCCECVDMNFIICRKQIDISKGAIKWELWREKYPLIKEYDSKADFEEGELVNTDIETNPGFVQLVQDGGLYASRGDYSLKIDMTQQPEGAGEWNFILTKPMGTSISFKAYASETGEFMGEEIYIGEVVSGAQITTKARWYKVVATLFSDEQRSATPAIDKIKVVFPNG